MRSMTMNMGTTKALRTASGNLAARRGSTLILVVATLALLAVLTVAYVSIGGGDRRSARTTTRAAEIDRQAQHIGDYLVGIVGDDALSVYFEGYTPDTPGTNPQPIFMTEAVDLPRTDFNRTFDGNPAPGTTPDPQDNYYGLAFTPTGSLPPLRASDDATDPMIDLLTDGGTLLLPFGPSDPFLAASEPTYIREENRPFNSPAYLDRVDWAKISNISPNGLFVNLWNLRGNFDAEPGVTTAGQMSHESTMFLTDRAGVPDQSLAYGGTADPRIPAHFDSMLVGAFQPINFVPTGVEVQDSEYPDYSWADADGDGYRDSRWQELVDIAVPGSPRRVVPNEGQLRWFVAARIIDLSGRVNVNTARGLLQPTADLSDVAGAPTNGNRLGASPADIDLFRLFTLEPDWAMHDEFFDSAVQPGGGAQDYSDYSDYSVSFAVGTQGFWAMRGVLTGVQPPAGPLAAGLPPQEAFDRRGEFGGLRYSGGAPLRSDDQGVYRDYSFGLEDLSELLAYNGLNNPQSLSSLERAAGGRDATDPNLSPMRDNRSLQWERALPDDPADTAPLALRHLGVRQHLTTLSGGIPRVPSRVRYTSASPTALDVFTSFASIPESTVALDPGDENPVVLQDGYRLLDLGAPTDLPLAGTVLQAEERLRRNAHPLLRTIGNALMPAASEPGAWAEPEWASTFYGFDPDADPSTYVPDPLFALRTSAHMVANLIDAFDGDDIPSAYTVLVQGDSSARNDLENDADTIAAFPWWTEPQQGSPTIPGISGRLDMGDERLPSTTAGTDGVLAMNVYGLEVHPFITQVSLYNVFTDSTDASGGDMDWPPAPSTGGGPIFAPGTTDVDITIDFDTDSGNSDFIGQVFAVQLTNPYTTDITVRSNQYYVRFGELGGNGPTSALPDGLQVPAGLVIPAGESVVAYIESDGFEMKARASAPTFDSVGNGVVDAWLDSHFSTDPTTTPKVRLQADLAGVSDFLAGDPGDIGDPASFANREVTLWTRLYRSNMTGSPPSSTTDVMLDRLYDPAASGDRPTLDRRPPAVNLAVDGAPGGPDMDPDPLVHEDNTGFSMLTWGTIARPRGAAAAPLGALPAYILETSFAGPAGTLNAAMRDDFNLPVAPAGIALTRTDFEGGAPELQFTLNDLLQAPGGSTAGGQAPTQILLDAQAQAHNIRQVVTANLDGVLLDQLYVNPFRNDNRGELDASASASVRMLRPGDFLGVPAVGPVQMPSSVAATPDELDWFTTGELLTLALGFDVAPASGTAFFYPSLPVNTDNVLDRGHLSLDLPAPFVDLATPSGFSAGDERRGLGVPHAMAVVSSITTLDVPINTRTPIAGIVNLNTATESVTSVLPGLTPSFDPAFSAWFEDRDTGTVLHDQRSDVAAGIRSYRDRSAAKTRRNTAPMPPFYDPSMAWGDSDPTQPDGRQIATGIDALREETGFLSVGEMLAANTPPPSGPIIGPSTYSQPHMIRRLGQDQFSVGLDGVDPVRYTSGGAVDIFSAAPGVDDGIVNDYDEQLALFNGVANTVSVRSDVYAIWFVMHGYAREDVEGLRDDDPMTPSVARRYLMVVDRSNVRRAGDKPKVLLFDELPL